MRSLPLITDANLEVTTVCPLRCPQCYCAFAEEKHMGLETAEKWIRQLAACGCKRINLSGGETRCYPHMEELLGLAVSYGLAPSASFSGWSFTESYAHSLISAGIDRIHISLNGSTEEINQKSREGYRDAVYALKTLQEIQFPRTVINWVMHSFNADDFPRMLELAERFEVCQITVMAFKPDARNQLPSLPNAQQMHTAAEQIRNYRGPVQIGIESCFSPMRALVYDTKFAGNLNRGRSKGCGAGEFLLSVNVDGTLSPCRHIPVSEIWDTVVKFWTESPLIQELRRCNSDHCKESPCSQCQYLQYCRHCMAINFCVEKRVHFGNRYCPLGTQE